MTKDYSTIADRLDKVAMNLRDAAERMEMQAKRFRKDPDPNCIGDILNELLWVLPNLGIQAAVNATIRELQRED